jgi:hypothetical protein
MKKPQLYVSLKDYQELQAEADKLRSLLASYSSIAELPKDYQKNMEDLLNLRLFWMRMQKLVIMRRQRGFGEVALARHAQCLVWASWRQEDGKGPTKSIQKCVGDIDNYETNLVEDIPLRYKTSRNKDSDHEDQV